VLGECVECGTPGERCCANRTCNDGGCCVGTVGSCYAAGANCPSPGPGDGMCAAGKCSGCGSMGQECCLGSTCYDGLNCSGGMCGPCGGAGQPACPGNACTAGGCLNDDQECIAAGTACGGMAGTCNANGTCTMGATTCGGLNQPCCEIGQTATPRFCAQPGTTCSGFGTAATCIACGELGQPCCEGDSCKTGTCGGNPDRCQ